MKILVSVASKHGATAEVAQEIGSTLREALSTHARATAKKRR